MGLAINHFYNEITTLDEQAGILFTSGNSLELKSGGDVLLRLDGVNGKLVIGESWTLPATAGTEGQVLKIDGAGNAYWGTSSGGGGITSVNGDTGPDVSLAYNNVIGFEDLVAPKGDGDVIAWSDTTNAWSVRTPAPPGIASLSEDPSPSLSATLETNGQDIYSNDNLRFYADNNISFYAGSGSVVMFLNGTTGYLNVANIEAYDGLKVAGVTYPTTAGAEGQVMVNNGDGSASWTTQAAGGLSSKRTMAYAKFFGG